MIKGTLNFKPEELEVSDTTKKNHIDNTIPEQYHKNASDLLAVLQKIRDALGKPMTITSGYRAPALNKKVGGASTSAHLVASAADLQVKGMTASEVWYFMQGFLAGNNISFDECIVESANKGRTQWTHFAIRSYNGLQRKKIKSIVL